MPSSWNSNTVPEHALLSLKVTNCPTRMLMALESRRCGRWGRALAWLHPGAVRLIPSPQCNG